MTIVEFADEEGQQAWARHRRHREAMAAGRDQLYEMYDIKVCSVIRASGHTADHSRDDSGG